MIEFGFTNFKEFVEKAFQISEKYDILVLRDRKIIREYRNYIYSLKIDTKFKDKMWCWLEGDCFDINDMYSMLGQNKNKEIK